MVISDCQLMHSNWEWIYSDWIYLILQAVIYIPLSWVRQIKHFSLTSLIADVFILLGLSYILFYDLRILLTKGIAPNIINFNMESFSLFIGTSMFAFEGICLILPISDSMKRPEKFGSVLYVLIYFSLRLFFFINVILLCSTISMISIGATFLLVGTVGYLTFGDKVETIVFLNLPSDSKIVPPIQFLYVIAIMLSVPLTAYPSIKIFEGAIFGSKNGKSSYMVKWQKNLFRTAFISLTTYIAFAGSNSLEKFVSLVGCLACIPLRLYFIIFYLT
jgi:solute carrier family 36 (proton-coupled amino acid transporter)